MKSKWIIGLEDGLHSVVAERPVFRRAKVILDGDIICETWNIKNFRFYINNHELLIKEKGVLTPRLVLYVDGAKHEPATVAVITSDLSENINKMGKEIQILDEGNIQESEIIVDIEEFPLDNSAGTDALKIEHEISKSVSNELSVDSSTQKGRVLNQGLISLLKLEISSNLSKHLGHNIGETITRRQKLVFTVQPRHSVVYKIIWKRKIRTASCGVLVDGRRSQVNYKASYDLTYEVKSEKS